MRNDEDLETIYNWIKILIVVVVSGFIAIAGLIGYVFACLL